MSGSGTQRLPLLIVFCLTPPVHADLKIRVKETTGTTSTSRTEYFKPHFRRTEWEDGATIVDLVNRRFITIDKTARQYSVNQVNRSEPPAEADQTVVVEIATEATREQRRVFGHTARHIITTERRHTEFRDRPPADANEIVTDGWYLDVPGQYPLSRVGAVARLVVSQGHPPALPGIRIRRSGHPPAGLPIWEKSGDHLLEVTGLSEAPLDSKLFEPPSGFRQVPVRRPGDPLSLSDSLELYWQHFVNWVESLP